MDKTKTLELLKKKSHAVTNQDVDYLFSANKSKTKGFFSLIYGKIGLIDVSKVVEIEDFKTYAILFADKEFKSLRIDSILKELNIVQKPEWLKNYRSFDKSGKLSVILDLKKALKSKKAEDSNLVIDLIVKLFDLDSSNSDFRVTIAKNLARNGRISQHNESRFAYELNNLIQRLLYNQKGLRFDLYYNLKEDYFTMSPHDEFQFKLGTVQIEIKKGKLNSLGQKMIQDNVNCNEVFKEELSNKLLQFIKKAEKNKFDFKNFNHKEVPLEFVSENSIIEGLSELKLKDAKTILEGLDEDTKAFLSKIISDNFSL